MNTFMNETWDTSGSDYQLNTGTIAPSGYPQFDADVYDEPSSPVKSTAFKLCLAAAFGIGAAGHPVSFAASPNALASPTALVERDTETTESCLEIGTRATRNDSNEPGRFSTSFPTAINAAMDDLKRIDELRGSEPSWAGRRVDAPSTTSALRSKHIVLSCYRYGLPPDSVIASGEGGVALCFVNGNLYADIECLNSGDLLACTLDRASRAPQTWEFEMHELPKTIARIQGFLQSHGNPAV
jgi:hypothetical protein